MFKRNFSLALLLALLSPAAALALGLGDIHLKSSLNAPLDADIDLVGASAEDLGGMKATLADRDAFNKGGLDYPGFLGALTITPEKTADGRSVLHVHSANAANEPFATLLISVDWPRGHVVREYTVLLDPPVFSGEGTSKAAVAAPSAGSSARSGSVEHHPTPSPAAAVAAADNSGATEASASNAPAVAAAAASADSTPTPAPAARGSSAARAAGGRYTVRPGDTLYSVATQNYPGGDRPSRQRQLVAIYRANPSAFEGNMNLLLAGRQLEMPGEGDIEAISPGEAASEVHRQNAAWAGAHGGNAASHGNAEAAGGQLHLVPPQEAAKAPASGAPSASASAPAPAASAGAAAGAATAAAAAKNDALNQRVSQLEAQLAESQRLLQLRNADLAALQARAAAQNVQPAAKPAAPTPPAAAPPVAEAPIAPSTPSAPVTGAPVSPPSTPAATPKPSPSPAAAPSAASGSSLLDLIEQYWYVPAALLAVLIILVVLRFVRARQEDEFDRSLGRLQPSFENSAEGVRATDTVPVRTLPASRGEMSYSVEESGPHEQPTFAEPPDGGAASIAATGQHVAIDDTVTGERPVALDQGDPLAEADFHMAYGLYDQAADLVQIAISREPNRRELKLKLLEVFFVWGNKERFLQTARELANTRSQALAGEWEKIVIMGRQIAPDDALFANAGTLTGAASGGVDLNLEGGQNRVDFDLLGEPSVGASAEGSTGLDLDLGAALGDNDATGEVKPLGENGVDFVLDDPERGNDATGSTREMPGGQAATREMPNMAGTSAPKEYTATMRVVGGQAVDPEAPTVEQPQLHGGDHSTIREKIDAAARAGMQTSDQTAELALDDLGLDLGALEGVADETGVTGSSEAPTVLSNLEEDTRELLARARKEQAESDATQRAPAADAPSDSGTWLFTDTDFANGMDKLGKDFDAEGSAPTQLVTQISPRPPFEADSGSATSRLAALDPGTLDLDVGAAGEDTGVNGVDLDVGAPAPATTEGTFVQTQRIAAGDMALPELEPATMSEVGTKLDLARAYMDMGDPEGARSILAEVLSEGSVSQKQEARRLMDTLPG
ncbi:MAG TPA: FimV/HubP family polar landmark protein [Steroidobacteraceae bacterium]|jgi:pilus assembly protein FimV